jgi:hypothetical protein
MGRYSFIVVFFSLLGLVAAVVPEQKSFDVGIVTDVPKDSSTLAQDTIYICKGHFFEWCTEPSTCGYCNESLDKTSLWQYYKLLECEECQEFFDENYYKFIQAQPEL